MICVGAARPPGALKAGALSWPPESQDTHRPVPLEARPRAWLSLALCARLLRVPFRPRSFPAVLCGFLKDSHATLAVVSRAALDTAGGGKEDALAPPGRVRTFSSSVSFFLPEQPAFPRLAKWKHRLGSDESPEVTESAV